MRLLAQAQGVGVRLRLRPEGPIDRIKKRKSKYGLSRIAQILRGE